MFCKNCGAPLANGSNFCAACGTQVVEETAAQTNQVFETNPQPAMPADNQQFNQVQEPVQQNPAMVNNYNPQVNMNAQFNQQANPNVQMNQQIPQNGQPQANQAVPANNTKTMKILAYIGILVLIPMFSSQKNDPSVKFHVGQGLLVCILGIIVTLIDSYLIPLIFKNEITYYGISFGSYGVSPIGVAIMWILGIIVAVFEIIGIVNVCNNKDKKLPLIGNLAFYK